MAFTLQTSMEREEGIPIQRAISESSLHGKYSDGTSRTGTRSAAQEHPDIGFGPRQPLVGSSFHYSYRHRRNKLYIELAARPTGEDLRICQEEILSLTSHLNHLHHLTAKLNSYLK